MSHKSPNKKPIRINIPSGPHQAPQTPAVQPPQVGLVPQPQNAYTAVDMTEEMLNQYK